MAKFPSLQSVIDLTLKTVYRFPFEFFATLIGTIYSLIIIDNIDNKTDQFNIKVVICSSLCLVLFLSLSLYFESKISKNWTRFATSIFLGGLIALFVFNLSEEITFIEGLQLFVLSIALHLLVSFAGFIPKKYDQEEFWEFNKQLFIRIITSGIYSSVLYVGLALAITAVTKLFNVEFYKEIYGDLFIIIAGLFNTIFFLAGIPETNNTAAPIILSYPKGLKNFTQYVLMPLISLYLVILISYEAKIVVTFSLPVGWVSYLVLIFAIFGILSFLLIHPIAKETGNLWMRTFSRWFYFLLVPLLGLLFWAILYRVNLYGFTHERYYVLLLSIWLSVVVAYFIIQKQPKIKFIPISMCLFGLLSIAGPQSADSISKHSQLLRFEQYMKIVEKDKFTFKQEQDLSSIVTFLEENYGVKVLLPFTGNKLTTLIKKDKTPNSSQIMEAFGLQYRSDYDKNENDENYFNYNFNENDKINNVHGYDLSFTLSNFGSFEDDEGVKFNDKIYKVKSVKQNYGLDLQINQDRIPLKIYDFINSNSAFELNDNSDEKITQKIETVKYDILITYSSVNGSKKGKIKTVENYEIKVLVKIKN
ncbi:MAG: hypothetical protein RL308_1479 [Bacteroidota bacterium]|jgi:hypothetical protein